MADYGFRAVNPNSGLVQVDSTYKNYSLRYKQSFTLSAGASGMYQGSISLPVSATACIAWRSTEAACFGWRSGNQLYFRSFEDGGRPAATITVYVFDETGNGELFPGAYGMRVRNAAGEVTFDSRMKYMRWIDQVSGHMSTLNTTKSYAAGVVPAVIQGNLYYTAEWIPVGVGTVVPYIEIFLVQTVRASGSSLIFAPKGASGQQTFNPPPVPPGRQYGYSYTIIDVAGL